MNELKFTEFVEQACQNTNFPAEGENNSTNSQEVMQFSGSSARFGQFPSLSPAVLFGYNYKESNFNTQTHSGPMAAEKGGENVKELWSAEELTVNLVNKTAMRIANLKHKLDEQLKNIKTLQENEGKYRDYPEPINHEQKNVDNFGIPSQGFSLPNNQVNVNRRIVKTPKQSGLTKTGKQRPTVPEMKKRKRLRRGVPLKEFFYHPLVVDCNAALPEDLTKEEFLRQLRLIPKSYFMTQNNQEQHHK